MVGLRWFKVLKKFCGKRPTFFDEIFRMSRIQKHFMWVKFEEADQICKLWRSSKGIIKERLFLNRKKLWRYWSFFSFTRNRLGLVWKISGKGKLWFLSLQIYGTAKQKRSLKRFCFPSQLSQLIKTIPNYPP